MSSTDPFKHSFTESSCLTEAELFALLRGQLDSSRLHYVKQHLQQCDLCSTAIEGFRQPESNLIAAQRNINSILQQTTISSEGKRNSMPKIIALSVVVVVGLFYWFFSSSDIDNEPKERKRLSTTQPVDEQETIAVDTMTFAVDTMGMADSLPKAVIAETPTENVEEEETVPVSEPNEQVVEPAKAKISGTIRNDLSTDGLAGADVRAVRYGKVVAKTKTKNDGSFNFSNITPGVYDIVISKAGYDEVQISKRFISSDESNKIDAALISHDQVLKRKQDSLLSVQRAADARKLALEKARDENILPDDSPLPGEENDDYYKGKRQYEKGNYRRAIKFFEKVLEDNQSKLHDSAKWFKSLSLIGMKEYAEARVLLQQIISQKGAYSGPAYNKLTEIKNK